MKAILSSMLALTFALGLSVSVFAADRAVDEAWYNTRVENLPHEWAHAKREAKAGNQFASSGSIQSDASNQNNTRTLSLTRGVRLKSTWIDTFDDKPWSIH